MDNEFLGESQNSGFVEWLVTQIQRSMHLNRQSITIISLFFQLKTAAHSKISQVDWGTRLVAINQNIQATVTIVLQVDKGATVLN